MMSALGELGRTGLTAVGNSHEEARATYAEALAVLDEEARANRHNDEIRMTKREIMPKLE